MRPPAPALSDSGCQKGATEYSPCAGQHVEMRHFSVRLRTFARDMGTQPLEERHAAFCTHAEAVEVQPVRLQRQRLLHGCHQVSVTAAAVCSPQQRQHQRVTVAPREGEWSAVSILQRTLAGLVQDMPEEKLL